MTTGLIYKAENLINGKCYIGQTTNTLQKRIIGHYDTAKRFNYKFSKALKKYTKENWTWEILEDSVELENLNNRETYYIEYFNSYHKGYNSTKEGGTTRGLIAKPYIYVLYKPDYGVISGTRNDLVKLDPALHYVTYLTANRCLHINGFVLAENKDKYNSIRHIYDFYHPDYGIVTSSISEFNSCYFPNTKGGINKLISGKGKSYKGWVLAKYKDSYNQLLNIITLEHKEYGIHTLPTLEFYKKFNLRKHQMSRLKRGEYKEINGWKLVIAP